MSIAGHALAEWAIAQVAAKDSTKKAPPRRTATALSDEKAVPETR